jgi:hypothetical protein
MLWWIILFYFYKSKIDNDSIFLQLLFVTNDKAKIKIFILSNILFYVFFYGMKEREKKEQSIEGICLSIHATHRSCCDTYFSKIFRLDILARAWWCSFISTHILPVFLMSLDSIELFFFSHSLFSSFLNRRSFFFFLRQSNVLLLPVKWDEMRCINDVLIFLLLLLPRRFIGIELAFYLILS